MDNDKVIKMVYSGDYELSMLGATILVEQMNSIDNYAHVKSIVSRFPHKQGRKELRIMAQKKHLKNLEDARRIQQDLSNARKQGQRDAITGNSDTLQGNV